jgi:hypothetical protein
VQTDVVRLEFVEKAIQFAVSLTDGSILHYAIAKIFEIAAMGQLLLLDSDMQPVVGGLGFNPGEHYLTYDSRNMTEVLKFAVSGKASVLRMRQAAQSLALRFHTTRLRAQQLHQMMACMVKLLPGAPPSECAAWRYDSHQSVPLRDSTRELLRLASLATVRKI